MPNRISDQSDIIKGFKVGQILNRDQVQSAALWILTKPKQNKEETELNSATASCRKRVM